MVKVSVRRSVIVVGITIILAGFPLAVFANHSWNGFHWARINNPFTVKLGNNLSGQWLSDPQDGSNHLSRASLDWNRSTVLDTTIVTGSSSPRTCRAVAGTVQVCNAAYGNTGWLGVAQVSVNGTHITQATVKLNDTYFKPGAIYYTSAWREMVACQEIGHTFGLNHQDTNFNNTNLGTCMDYTNDPTGTAGTNGTLSNISPNQHDYDELTTIYSHSDTTTTLAAAANMPPAMSEIDLSGPAQWGRVIQGSREAGSTIHELDFGGGNKVFTFVTWAKRN